jgi:hypothetical protein
LHLVLGLDSLGGGYDWTRIKQLNSSNSFRRIKHNTFIEDSLKEIHEIDPAALSFNSHKDLDAV